MSEHQAEIEVYLDDWNGTLQSSFWSFDDLQVYLTKVYRDGYGVTGVRWDGRLCRNQGGWLYPQSNIESTSVPSTYDGPTNDNYANNE